MEPEPLARRAVTRTDVANHAGVSTAVVSYVVNDGPRNVAPATRTRVLESISVLGYRPNAAARALKVGVTELIGVVMPDSTNPFFAEYARALEKAAAAKGLSMILVNSARDNAHETELIHKLSARQVDALLLAAADENPELSSAFESNIPVVLLNRTGPKAGIRSIGVDFRGGSKVAVEHLIGHGHRRIGLISGITDKAITFDRERGWQDALLEAGLDEGPIERDDFTREGGYDAAKRLLKLPVPPTAIYVGSDIQAVGLLRALHEAGVLVPGEIAVVSFDGSAESEFSWPPLTSMRQPVSKMAHAAIEALAEPDGGRPHHREFTAELVVRQSCGCPS